MAIYLIFGAFSFLFAILALLLKLHTTLKQTETTDSNEDLKNILLEQTTIINDLKKDLYNLRRDLNSTTQKKEIRSAEKLKLMISR